jgi:GH25 family lysozyme M1 (1,4-beta-N-acetylmuramidase)
VKTRGSKVVARRFPALAAFACLTALALLTGGAPAAAADGPFGIDVSHHNGTPNWNAAAADGVTFAIAKATEGQTFVDDQYAANMAQADAQGVPFTAYHFARPDKTPDDALLEADHFVDTAALRGKHLLPVLDLESSGDLGARKLRSWVKTWLARVRVRLGVKAIIYTSASFWTDHMGNSRWFADNGYRLWVAHWHVDTPRVPASNWGGRGWTLWQYDNCGSVAGLSGCVDLDRYAGTAIGALRIKNNR